MIIDKDDFSKLISLSSNYSNLIDIGTFNDAVSVLRKSTVGMFNSNEMSFFFKKLYKNIDIIDNDQKKLKRMLDSKIIWNCFFDTINNSPSEFKIDLKHEKKLISDIFGLFNTMRNNSYSSQDQSKFNIKFMESSIILIKKEKEVKNFLKTMILEEKHIPYFTNLKLKCVKDILSDENIEDIKKEKTVKGILKYREGVNNFLNFKLSIVPIYMDYLRSKGNKSDDIKKIIENSIKINKVNFNNDSLKLNTVIVKVIKKWGDEELIAIPKVSEGTIAPYLSSNYVFNVKISDDIFENKGLTLNKNAALKTGLKFLFKQRILNLGYTVKIESSLESDFSLIESDVDTFIKGVSEVKKLMSEIDSKILPLIVVKLIGSLSSQYTGSYQNHEKLAKQVLSEYEVIEIEKNIKTAINNVTLDLEKNINQKEQFFKI